MNESSDQRLDQSWTNIFDLLYPRRCPICGEILEKKKWLVCPDCQKQLPFVRGPVCHICGKPVNVEDDETPEQMPHGAQHIICPDCQQWPHHFDQGMGIFCYDSVMRGSLGRFKYHDCMEYARFYGAAAWQYGKDQIRQWNPQVIIPVPIHKRRRAKRGYNQAELFAKELSKHSGVPTESQWILRKTNTVAQKELDRQQRMENLAGAFCPARDGFPYKRVLLVDDIYTTGSTADAVALVLRQMGAQEIYVLSVCIGIAFMVK